MSNAPVFIVGAPRSGTTLLRQVLNAHPALHLTFEASFFNVVKAMPRRLSGDGFRAAWTGSLPFAWQRVAPEDLATAAPSQLAPRDPRWFTALMQHCAHRAGKTRWGDKSPLHVYEVGALLDAFPDARVVHIVRDPVAVVRSLSTVPWAGINLFATAVTVRVALDAVRPHRERICEVRLEDLLADRVGELRRILDFCELEWSDRVLEPEVYAPQDGPPLPWLATRSAERSKLPARPSLLPEDAYRISRITAPQRRRYGYAPLPVAGRSLGGHLARAWADVRELVQVVRSLRRLRRVLHGRPRPGPVEVFDAVNSLHPEAVLACTPTERAHLVSWLRSAAPSG